MLHYSGKFHRPYQCILASHTSGRSFQTSTHFEFHILVGVFINVRRIWKSDWSVNSQ